jgi:hypothetical protein
MDTQVLLISPQNTEAQPFADELNLLNNLNKGMKFFIGAVLGNARNMANKIKAYSLTDVNRILFLISEYNWLKIGERRMLFQFDSQPTDLDLVQDGTRRLDKRSKDGFTFFIARNGIVAETLRDEQCMIDFRRLSQQFESEGQKLFRAYLLPVMSARNVQFKWKVGERCHATLRVSSSSNKWHEMSVYSQAVFGKTITINEQTTKEEIFKNYGLLNDALFFVRGGLQDELNNEAEAAAEEEEASSRRRAAAAEEKEAEVTRAAAEEEEASRRRAAAAEEEEAVAARAAAAEEEEASRRRAAAAEEEEAVAARAAAE